MKCFEFGDDYIIWAALKAQLDEDTGPWMSLYPMERERAQKLLTKHSFEGIESVSVHRQRAWEKVAVFALSPDMTIGDDLDQAEGITWAEDLLVGAVEVCLCLGRNPEVKLYYLNGTVFAFFTEEPKTFTFLINVRARNLFVEARTNGTQVGTLGLNPEDQKEAPSRVRKFVFDSFSAFLNVPG